METNPKYGTLYIVATPLGNLEDITFRAIQTLKQVNLIAAEDTRHSRKLLNHYHITTQLISCHEHNEVKKIPVFLEHLKNGQDIALISDAGTPTISDPGFKLVKEAGDQKINIIPIPGCNAAIAGLSVSGLPTDTFMFLGFAPKKLQKLTAYLEGLKHQKATLIFYESPRRIQKLVQIIIDIFGNRQGCLAREITKLHEEYIRGSLSDILLALDQKQAVKGECSLFVQGEINCPELNDMEIEKIVQREISRAKMGTSALARQISDAYNQPRKKIYDLILKLSKF